LAGACMQEGQPPHKLKDYNYKPSRKRLASILVGIGYRWESRDQPL